MVTGGWGRGCGWGNGALLNEYRVSQGEKILEIDCTPM